MKGFCIFPILLLLLLSCACASPDATNYSGSDSTVGMNYKRLKQQARTARVFCLRNGMDSEICILADMQVHSGKTRMAVWNFNTDTIIASGLVSHGCGSNPWGKDKSKDRPVFSNAFDSHCSSLGKYSIGERGYSSWGIHVKYLLHGLEAGNSNALRREIVLHGWDAITDQETFPNGAPEGWGCPAVSNTFMQRLDDLLKHRRKPVLLWIYN